MTASQRWILVVSALVLTYATTRRLFAGALREAPPARRALGRGRVYDPFLVDHGRGVVAAMLAAALVDGALAAAPRFGAALRDAAAGAFVGWCLLLLWVDLRLARTFRAAADPPPLMSDGPYALVRHPRYLCWLGLLVSLVVVADSPLGLVLLAGFLGLVVRRIMREERYLLARYGCAYARYAARTYRLVPWVY